MTSPVVTRKLVESLLRLVHVKLSKMVSHPILIKSVLTETSYRRRLPYPPPMVYAGFETQAENCICPLAQGSTARIPFIH